MVGEWELGIIHSGPGFAPIPPNLVLHKLLKDLEVLSLELSLQTRDIHLPFHGEDVPVVSNGATQSDAPIASPMDNTRSSVNRNGIVSISRKHDIILLTSFAACHGGRPGNALWVEIIQNHPHEEFDLIICVVRY